MSSRYQGRHATPGRRAKRPSVAARALRRPIVTGALLAAAVATSAAGYQATDGHQTGTAAFTVSTEAIAQANELADAQIEDTARMATQRNEANASMAALQEQDRRKAVAAAAAAAAARKQEAERVAREKARQALADQKAAILARAKEDPKAVARVMLGDFGWGAGQFSCLDRLWIGESNWNYRASNSSSGAYGIPQALPGSKMGTVAADWRDNPATQIEWGLGYIKRSYGSPCNALAQWQGRSPHWY